MPSLLWDHYEAKGGKARCKHCPKEVSTPGGTTSGMKKHLGTHPKEMEEYLKKQEEIERKKGAINPKRPAEDQGDSRPLKQTRLDFGAKEVTKAKQKDFDDALVNFVAETGVSFNVLGTDSFKEMIGVANRQLDVKDPRTYSRKVDGASRSVLSRVTDIQSAVKSTIPSVGFTSDMWTSRAQVVVIFILQQFVFMELSPFLNC